MDTAELVERILPTKLSQTLASLSVLLAVGAFAGFEHLPSAWLPTQETERFLWRLLIAESFLLIGALATIAALVHHFNERPDLKAALEEANKRVPDTNAR